MSDFKGFVNLIAFSGVLSRHVSAHWPEVAALIESGLTEGLERNEIYGALLTRKAQLWMATTNDKLLAACVTEIANLPARKVLNIISVGGTQMSEWLHCMATLEAFAREKGCTAMRFPEIRPGWAKVLTGFKTTRITLEKKVL